MCLYNFFSYIITFIGTLFSCGFKLLSGVACDIWNAIYINSHLFVFKKTRNQNNIQQKRKFSSAILFFPHQFCNANAAIYDTVNLKIAVTILSVVPHVSECLIFPKKRWWWLGVGSLCTPYLTSRHKTRGWNCAETVKTGL